MTIDQLCDALKKKAVGQYVVYPVQGTFSDANMRALKGSVEHGGGPRVEVYRARGQIRVKRLN